MKRLFISAVAAVTAALTLGAFTSARSGYLTSEPPQMRGDTPATSNGWEVKPLITIGEQFASYYPPGLPDGMGAYRVGAQTVRVFLSHELSPGTGPLITLDNGGILRGARVSYLDFNRYSRELIDAGLAFGTIYNRAGHTVESTSDLEFNALNRFCSANLVEGGTYNLVDTIFFTGEETAGGTEFALDVANREIWAAPWLGRAAFENVALVDPGDANKVAMVMGDDREGAPLLLYVGERTGSDFLGRNGLAQGTLYIWVADNGDTSPQEWNGTGTSRTGTFVALDHYRPDLANNGEYGPLGFATQETQDALVVAAGGFHFSRPEDVSTNPANPTQVVMASTGRGSAYPADTWGSVYVVDLDFGATITGTLHLIYDGDDAGAGQFAHPDFGPRSPDNLDWADNGKIYLQEDRATSPSSLFGGTSGIESSMWELDPATGTLVRIAEIDRSAVPSSQNDTAAGDLGNWENSGVLDVTSLFWTRPGERLLIATTQAHSLTGIDIILNSLVQGGQIFFVSDRLPKKSVFTFEASPGREADRDLAEGSAELASVMNLTVSPNPAPGHTTVHFANPASGAVRADVFDISGRHVRTLVEGELNAGAHQLTWNGRGDHGRDVGPGVYFVRVITSTVVDQVKVMVVH